MHPFRLLLLPVAFATASCNWLSLARHSLTYRELRRGETGNLAAHDSLVYATVADDGVIIVDARSGTRLATIAPPPGSESIDDVAVADGLLFALDARPPGHVSVYSLEHPLRPQLVSPPRPVPVGPFSGISAAAGICIVSGGTSDLTVWRYDRAGLSAAPVATADLGRGQPDVLLAPDGRLALVSTHHWGPYFGLDVVALDAGGQPGPPAELEIAGAGFTAGGARPANFPIEAAVLGRDTVLVAHAGGVAFVDVRTPDHPVLRATIDLGGPAVNVDARGNTVLVAVAGEAPALVLLEVAGGRAALARRIPLPSGTLPGGVALTATHAAVALAARGVQTFER